MEVGAIETHCTAEWRLTIEKLHLFQSLGLLIKTIPCGIPIKHYCCSYTHFSRKQTVREQDFELVYSLW